MKRLLLILLALARVASALEVRETIWGFNGQATPGAFNPLSVLVENPATAPFDGALELVETRGGGSVGARLVQPVFVAPFTARWVQFYPFVSRENEWLLSWGHRAQERAEVATPKFTAPVRVLLADANDTFARPTKLRTFPENLFPPTVSATDGLASVVLDHAPRWEPAKREAFLDWIRRGGTLHVLHGADGKFPIFPDELAALNFESERVRVGAGAVVRHPFPRDAASDEKLGEPLPELKNGKQVRIYSVESSFFQMLASFTRPDINWGFIYGLAVLYLGAVGPWHYLWGRKKKSRVVLAALLGIVVLFALLFGMVGRRGYGETASVHSLAWARALGGGRFDVMEWDNVFVTRGDFYALKHDAAHNLYGTPDENDGVNGRVTGGRDGGFDVDIPLYSSRAFVHHAVLKGDDTGVNVLEWDGGDRLTKLTLATPPGFPKNVLEVWARGRKEFYKLRVAGNRLELTDTHQTAEAFFTEHTITPTPAVRRFSENGKTVDTETEYRASLPVLLARALGGTDQFQRYIESSPLPADCLQLFIFARSPDGFRVRAKGFDKQTGFVLYEQKIFKPTATP